MNINRYFRASFFSIEVISNQGSKSKVETEQELPVLVGT